MYMYMYNWPDLQTLLRKLDGQQITHHIYFEFLDMIN